MNISRKGRVMAFLGAAAAVCTLLASLPGKTSRAEISDEKGMFVSTEKMEIAADAALPDEFLSYDGGTVSRDFDLGMRGVRLSSEEAGAEVSFAPLFAGDFELTFRIYSEMSYHPATENDYNTTAVDMTPYIDLKEIFFDFTDQSGKTFTVAIAGGERWNIITPAARVIVGGTAVGYHYATDSKVPSETGLKNSEGYYTRIGGTTFCNVARRGGNYTSENSLPVTFGFDADTGEIYVMHCGTSDSNVVRRVVYDLDAEDSGLRGISDFGRYGVKVRFGEIAEGKTANAVFYELNGQSLAGESFADDAGAQTIVSAEYNAVVGKAYALPAPAAFDVLEGEIPFEGDVTVSRGGVSVPVYGADGSVVSEYEAGCRFVPDAEGIYEISYVARDGKGNEGEEKTLSVHAFASAPETDFRIEGNYGGLNESPAVGKGSLFGVYPARVSCGIFADGRTETAEVKLLRDGVVAAGPFTADEYREIELEEEGEYALVYFVKGYEEFAERVEFSVSDAVPVYKFASPIPARAAVGTEFSVPSLTAELGGESKRATAVLYAPDGSAVALKNNMAVLSVPGEYKLTYYVRFASTYTYTTCFEAAYSVAGAFEGDGTSAAAEAGDSGSLYPGKAYGTVLTFTSEDSSARYSKTVDLSKNTKEDPLIRIMVLPSVKGELDLWQYTVRLTDVNDSRNYVSITAFKGSWGNEFSYIRAGGAEQMLAGWEMGSVLTAYNTGCPVNYSFTGESIAGTEFLTLYYDYAENAVYVDNIKREGYEYGNQVIDLDSLECFSENTLFKGFSTGEVYLSVSAQYLQGESARLLIGEVNGVSLGEEWIDDTEAPKLGVDFGEYAEDALPCGEAGTAYPVFSADAFDAVEGKTDTEVSVWRDYQTSAQEEIDTDGKTFLPDRAGEYTILYTAADHSGNTAQTAVRVTVVERLPEFSYVFEEEPGSDYFLGERFQLSSGVAGGGSGEVAAEISLVDPSGGESVPQDYVFEEPGTYRLVVSFSDFLGRTGEIVREITVRASDSPVVYGAEIPEAMLNGREYELPDFYAVDYSTGKPQTPEKRVEAVIGGKVQTVEDGKFVPRVSAHGEKIELRYIAENAAGKQTVLSYEIAVLKPENENGDLDLSKYFFADGFYSSSIEEEYAEYRTATDGARLVFVNPLIVNNLALEFYVPASGNAFGGFVVTLTDSEDPSVSVSAFIEKGVAGGSTSGFDCGNGAEEIAGNFFDKTTYGISFSFNNNSLYFIDLNENKSIDKPSVTDAGEPFAGFPSQKVYLTVRMVGVTGESTLRVLRVGNQYFSDVTNDRIAPQLQLFGFVENTADIGVPYTAPAAAVADVLNPDAEVKLIIRKDSKVIYEGSADEPYIFTPTEYGVYNFRYEGTAGGRTVSAPYVVTVKDKVAPALTVNGDVPAAGKVGEAVVLPSASVSDNDATDMRIWIFVTEPKGKMYALPEGESGFTPQSAGNWLVTYYAEDDYGNYDYCKYTISVS